MPAVQFRYLTGLQRAIFRHARLLGTWDSGGRHASEWREVPMRPVVADDGCPGFEAEVELDAGDVGRTFRWTVRLDTPAVADVSGMPTERNEPDSTERTRAFVLTAAGQTETYRLTYARHLGAHRVFTPGDPDPGLQFGVWAPHARAIDVVFGDPDSGYIADDGTGIDASRPPVPMRRVEDGIWQSDVLATFASHEGLPYMYRIVNAQGRTVYRTDIFSRQQIGRGTEDPADGHWNGTVDALDGTKSCSVVVDVDRVSADPPHGRRRVTARVGHEAFWAHEYTPGLPVPSRIDDLVIYELHVSALGFGKSRTGNLQDAIDLLDHLTDLGVNAVELMPLSEFSGVGWGYGDSHHFVIESLAGTRDDYKHFVRACHRRGIAVIQDVVYNHFDHDAARAQWAYDSDAPDENIYYWYDGRPADYASPDGGYVDNGSSGYTPRFSSEIVRQLFVSSAAAFVEELHVDGLRVDLTQAMHRDNRRHADGRVVAAANQCGAKLLREWSRTLRLIKPTVMLIAEDHSGWDKVVQLPEAGGLGFDARWHAAFYHNLVGDSDMAGGRARLLQSMGFGDDRALDLPQFASVLFQTKYDHIVYHESHDEAGNAGGSRRTLSAAVNGAPLVGDTRDVAEARTRVAVALAMFSAGTPMFFMGEEVGAARPYRYDDFMAHREDLAGERRGHGARLFRYFQDAIRFRHRHPALRARSIDIVHVNGDGRVLAFRRSSGSNELLVVASLSNRRYDRYEIRTERWRLEDGLWRELFNSNAGIYGGDNVGNFGADIAAGGGSLALQLPANGVIVLQRT